MIRAVLLVPTEGDPHGLLTEGPCGARPPTAWFARCKGVLVPAPHAAARRCGHCDRPLAECQQRALVLAWDGEPVAEGCLRACGMDSIFTFWRSVSESIEGVDCALAWLGQRCIDHDLGSLVLLGAEGQEIQP